MELIRGRPLSIKSMAFFSSDGSPLDRRWCPISLWFLRFLLHRKKISIATKRRATPSIDPKTAPRTLTGNGGSELALAAAAAVVVDAGSDDVWAVLVGADEAVDDKIALVVGIEVVPS
jgi:hypothetical protein